MKLQSSIFSSVILLPILLFASCEFIDSTFDSIDNLFDNKEGKALKEVLTLQDEASIIVDELFAINMDTLSVIDSIYSFFLNNNEVEYVVADSQGVAVDYKNGISGGVFIGILQTPITLGSTDDSLLFDDENDSQLKSIREDITPTLKNSKTIYFDGAYSQFKETNSQVIAAANEGFAKIGMDAFVQYLDDNATVDVLSTLDQYGLIHITGHGWFRKYKNNEDKGFIENKRTYLLTGEKAEVGKTFGKYYADILAKDIIVVSYKPDKYSDERENRYWVSPKYVGDRNTFPENEVFLYLGICNGGRGFWRTELGKNNGMSAVIAYDWSVYPHWEYKWAMKFYQKMCDTSTDFPMTIGECIKEIIIKEKKGYYQEWGIDENSNYWQVNVRMIPSGNRDFTFWQPTDVIENLRLDFQNIQWDYSAFCYDQKPNPFISSHGVYHKEIEAKLIQSGNSYFASWNEPNYFDSTLTYYGSISFTLENDENIVSGNIERNVAKDVSFSINWGPTGTFNRDLGYNVTMKNAQYQTSIGSQITIEVNGIETCDLMTLDMYSLDCMKDNSYTKINSTGEMCVDNSYVLISLDLK